MSPETGSRSRAICSTSLILTSFRQQAERRETKKGAAGAPFPFNIAASLLRQLVVNALDVEVHAEKGLVIGPV
jgi:hypothetical protein